MSGRCTVVIGAPELLDALRGQAGADGEILTFTDRDALSALEAIRLRLPEVVVFERLFAATSRGAALINRIKADAALAAAEIRVVSHDGAYSRVSPRRAPAAPPAPPAPNDTTDTTTLAAAVVVPGAALDYRGTRRAPRYRMAAGTEAQINGSPGTVVDLSVIGAQMVSPVALRPLQRVRITLSDEVAVVKFKATVAWAAFEMANSTRRYRVGLEFSDAQAPAIEAFCARHQLV